MNKLAIYLQDLYVLIFSYFFSENMTFLFKMLVTFFLQRHKLLMRYFMLIFSYIIK